MSVTRPKRKSTAPYLKPEPVDEGVPVKLEPPISQFSPAEPELPYITPSEWPREQIIDLIVHNVLMTVAPKFANGTNVKFATFASYTGDISYLPTRYHTPVLWCLKRTWTMLRDAIVNGNRWDETRFDILHLARLLGELWRRAREAMASNGLDNRWRFPLFDVVLIRFKHRCFKLDPESAATFDANSQKIMQKTQDVLGTRTLVYFSDWVYF